jgi:MFS family permease
MSTKELSTTKETIVSLYQAGAFFGSLFAYVSAYFLGRKKSLTLFSIIFILGAGLMLGANSERGLGLILGGRVLAGIGVGACSMIVPIYISEISPPAVRGRLVGIYELGWQIGGLVGFVSSSRLVRMSELLTSVTVDQLWHPTNTSFQPRTMAHPLRRTTYPRRSPSPRSILDQGKSSLASVQAPSRGRYHQPLLDPQLVRR